MVQKIKNGRINQEDKNSIKSLKGKKPEDLSSNDIKKIVGYLAKKFGII